MLEETVNIEGRQIINFVSLSNNDLRTILEWRNHDSVRKWMINSMEISIESHLGFIEHLREANSKSYWMIKLDDLDFGVVYFVDINHEEKTAELGLYLNPEMLASGLGYELFYLALQLGFNHLGLQSVYSQSKVENRNTLILHDFFGMIETCILQKNIAGIVQDFSYRTLHVEDFQKLPQSFQSLKQRIRDYVLSSVSSKKK
jgi:UDP-4-amino-4,6-dideoxy-N-acetyl-beta-L-altrosamine N-acetyltransferase